MALNDLKIRKLLPSAKAYKAADERGLFLLVQPSGVKLWRFKYRFAGYERKMTFGRYPEITLKMARDKRDAARRMLSNGVDPSAAKREAALDAALNPACTFRLVATEYIDKIEQEGRARATVTKARWFLDLIDRDLGHRPIRDVTPHELLASLRKIERRGHRETAHRARALCGRIFRYAVATSRATANPADLLKGALIAPRVKHHATILDPKGVGALLRAIEGYEGQIETRLALKLAPHLFVRPGELRQAEWKEFQFDEAVWKLPAEKMKMGQPHAIPLSRQVLELLDELRALDNHSPYLFPSLRTPTRPMSDGTLNAALRRIGYGHDDMTAHGFRAMASTLLNESGLWHPDAIERALAHGEPNRVRAAYHRGAHWQERVRMAQWWSDYLDQLRAGTMVLRPNFEASAPTHLMA